MRAYPLIGLRTRVFTIEKISLKDASRKMDKHKNNNML